MQVIDPLQANDWGINDFLNAVWLIQIGAWLAIALDYTGLRVPVLRPLILFIYICFVPGMLIIRILKIHKVGRANALLLTVGTSVIALMLMGLIINAIYPSLGIYRPITVYPLIMTLSAAVLCLSILCYKTDNGFCDPDLIDLNESSSPAALFLYLLPFLAIMGAYLVNFRHDNILMLILSSVIAILGVVVTFNRIITPKLYPLVIFSVSISLLLHASLISMYLTEFDIQVEYYFYKIVEMNGFWDMTIPNNTNSVLSTNVVLAIYSALLNIEGTWIFKIVFPFFFSMVPLGLYQIFKGQVGEKPALLGALYFSFHYVFFAEMIGLAKQEMAEMFYVLTLLMLFSEELAPVNRKLLYILFSTGIVFSHYGLGSLFMLFSAAAFIFSSVIRYRSTIFAGRSRIFSRNAVLLYIVIAATWYMTSSSSSVLVQVATVAKAIIISFFNEFLSPKGSQAIEIMIKPLPTWRRFGLFLNYIATFMMIIGILDLFISWVMNKKTEYSQEFAAFSLMSCSIFLASVLVPHFAWMSINRMHHLVIFFLSPFLITGGISIIKIFNKIVRLPWTKKWINGSLLLLSIFLTVFFVVDSGLVSAVSRDHPSSVTLSQESIKEKGDDSEKTYFYTRWCQDEDLFGAKWISANMDRRYSVYLDNSHRVLPFFSYAMMPSGEDILDQQTLTRLTNETKDVEFGSYLYMGILNTKYGLMAQDYKNYWNMSNMTNLSPILNKMGIIYTNGYCRIYR
jgi:uncharacterized membrane protein